MFPRWSLRLTRGHSWRFLLAGKGGWVVTRRVRPVVVRQRITERLERERTRMESCPDEELLVSPVWRQGYLAGLRIARVIVREGGE